MKRRNFLQVMGLGTAALVLSSFYKRESNSGFLALKTLESIGSPYLHTYQSLGIGMNIDGVFSRDKNGQLKSNYQNEDFDKIRKAGFMHVRLTIRVPLLNELKPDSISMEDIEVIKKVVDEILRNKLILIFNPVHASKEFKKRLENEPLLQTAFIKFWGDLAMHFSAYNSNNFIVEPFNEPHFKDADNWYHLQEQLVAEIRKAMPEKTILVTPVTETIAAVTSMKLLKDKNVLYSFHFYLPFELTHQGASWTWKSFPKGYTYPNNNWNIDRMRIEFFDPLHNWAQKNNISLYGGEFGVIKNADKDSRLKWLGDVAKLMKENKYPGAVWEFKQGDFSILSPTNNQSDTSQFDNDFLRVLGF